ncbi:MAG: PAS domain S-box protein [Planctomycetia bacterium]|nr:PAS domain S-box protein [Planctomycetia bacterium]
MKHIPSYEELLTELTNLKELQQQLVYSEEKYRSLTENLNVGIYRNTPGAKGKFIEVNPAFLQIFGYKNKNSILGLHVSDLYETPSIRKKVSDKLKKQGFLINEPVSLIKKDGTPIICSISATSIKDKSGKITHYDGIIEDITMRIKAESALKASEEKYHKLFDSAHDALMTLSPPAWKFTSGNPAILEMFKVKSIEEFLTYGPWNISPEKQPDGRLSSEKAKEMIEIAMTKGSNYFEWTHKRINGESFSAKVLLTKIQLKDKTLLQATVRDISERKKAEELREKLLDTARHLTRSLDLNTVLDQISKQARSLLDCHGITIYMLDKDGVTINPALSNDPPYDKMVLATKLNINKSLTGKVIKAKKGMIFNDTAKETVSFHVPGTPESDDDYIIISPFIIENKVIGTMNLYRGTSTFSTDDLVIVNTFAVYASTAIKNAKIYEDLMVEMKERQLAEKEAQINEEKYRTLTENLPLGVYRDTPGARGKFIEINQALVEMFGYKDKNSMMKINISKLYASPRLRKKFSDKLLKKGHINNEELQLVKQDGTRFVGSSTAIAVKNDKGKIIHYDGIIEDITERVVLRNKLIENEEKYRSIVNNSPDIIMRVDPKGTITYINSQYAGKTPEEVIGKTIYDLMPSEFHDKAKDSLRKVIDTGKSFSYEHIGLSNDDSVVWYRNNIGPIKSNSDVIGATIIARDITKRKQIDIIKNEFISSVSHELRTPLTIIQESVAQVLDGIYGDLSDGQKEILNPCMEDINRLNRIINDLLDISKIESQKILINREMIDIVKLAKSVQSSFKTKVAAKNIKLKLKTSLEAIEVYIDNDRIIQVFMNLIGNAVKFTEKGNIEISIIKSENTVECIVSDAGRGIEHKDIATVFDRFHQVGKIVNAEEKGTGLGLSICKGIVKLHNGQIWVDSQINKGSQFHFTLPIYTVDEILFDNIERGIVKATKKHIKLSLLIIRLNNFEEIENKFGLDKAMKTTHKVLEAFQDVIAPGEFSFIKGRNEVILFSDITQKNILSIVEKLENILANFISNFSKELDIIMSYGYSIYPNDANSAKDLLQSAYKTLLIKNNHK